MRTHMPRLTAFSYPHPHSHSRPISCCWLTDWPIDWLTDWVSDRMIVWVPIITMHLTLIGRVEVEVYFKIRTIQYYLWWPQMRGKWKTLSRNACHLPPTCNICRALVGWKMRVYMYNVHTYIYFITCSRTYLGKVLIVQWLKASSLWS